VGGGECCPYFSLPPVGHQVPALRLPGFPDCVVSPDLPTSDLRPGGSLNSDTPKDQFAGMISGRSCLRIATAKVRLLVANTASGKSGPTGATPGVTLSVTPGVTLQVSWVPIGP
jgi:hypothetical protein